MAKYILLTQDGYPCSKLKVGEVYEEDFSPYDTSLTVKKIFHSFPDDWELIDQLSALKEKAKELGYNLVKEDPSEWVVGRNRYFYEDDYLRIQDIEDGEYVCIQEDDLDEVIQKIQSIRNS